MKKFVSLLLILVLILSLAALAACSKSSDGEGSADEDALTVAIVVSSAFGDKSFNDSAKEGPDRLAEEYDNVKVSSIECKGENFKQNMIQAAEESDIVVLVGWEFHEVSEVAPEYPETKFIWVDNPIDDMGNLPNVICITYAQNEGSFLAGYIAAKMSKTGVIGMVGGEDTDTINDFYVGYEQGAKYAVPEITVEKIYANDYEDPAKGKECALALHDKKADIIFAVAGNTGNGVFEAAKEQGFYAIGVDSDQKISAAEYDEQIICSMKKDVGLSIYDTVKEFLDNQVWDGGKIWTADMSSGYVAIAYGDENSVQQVGDDLKAEADEISAKIVSGEIAVATTRK